jgi:hypothetical protein
MELHEISHMKEKELIDMTFELISEAIKESLISIRKRISFARCRYGALIVRK